MLPNESRLAAPAARYAVSARARSVPLDQPLAARLLARARALSLDRRLIAGENPASSRVLAARSAQLTSERSREEIARGLRRLVRSAEERPRRMRLRPRPAAVRVNEPALVSLAERLRGAEPLYARGMARLERLLVDASGPGFRGSAAELARELELAARELAGAATPAPEPHHAPRGPAPVRIEQPGFLGNSFVLPNGSWYHGRREGA
jgi:hypothetical protein